MVELAIVIVVTLILASTVLPRWLGTLSSSRVETAARQTVTALRFARQAAITSRRNVTVLAPQHARTLRLVSATGDTLARFAFPAGTSVVSSTGNPTFHARGTSFGATIVVGDSRSTRQIVVNSVSRIRVES